MVYITDEEGVVRKFACLTCIKGHRSSGCQHADRELTEIRRKGRPVSQCAHCRNLRKTKQVHIKCLCDKKSEVLSALSSTPPHSAPGAPGVRRAHFSATLSDNQHVDLTQQDLQVQSLLSKPCARCDRSPSYCICTFESRSHHHVDYDYLSSGSSDGTVTPPTTASSLSSPLSAHDVYYNRQHHPSYPSTSNAAAMTTTTVGTTTTTSNSSAAAADTTTDVTTATTATKEPSSSSPSSSTSSSSFSSSASPSSSAPASSSSSSSSSSSVSSSTCASTGHALRLVIPTRESGMQHNHHHHLKVAQPLEPSVSTLSYEMDHPGKLGSPFTPPTTASSTLSAISTTTPSTASSFSKSQHHTSSTSSPAGLQSIIPIHDPTDDLDSDTPVYKSEEQTIDQSAVLGELTNRTSEELMNQIYNEFSAETYQLSHPPVDFAEDESDYHHDHHRPQRHQLPAEHVRLMHPPITPLLPSLSSPKSLTAATTATTSNS